MHPSISKLIACTSNSLFQNCTHSPLLDGYDRLGQELAELLSVRNGFYSFDSALLVRPSSSFASPLGHEQWNDSRLWKCEYQVPLQDALFFAEDLFGVQFCFQKDEVCSFDPETAEFSPISNSLFDWIDQLLGDVNLKTGRPIAIAWQNLHGTLKQGERLLPKVPFVCGGKYEVDNLYAAKEIDGMKFRAYFANQIRDLPDGSEIIFRLA